MSAENDKVEGDDPPLDPDPPRPPGAPDAGELEVDVPEVERETPDTQDVTGEAGAVEPPD